MPVDKRLHKLESWAMDKLQKRYNDLNGASGASGSAGLLKNCH